MSLKNVVKVMNFHSLLRVEQSRRTAKKYSQMEDMVLQMLDNILHNRNVVLDIKALQTDPSKPQLCICLGSDLGFCGNLNHLVRAGSKEGTKGKKAAPAKEICLITVGKKLATLDAGTHLLHQNREEFLADHSEILQKLSEGLRSRAYSSIRLIYNHYRNSSQVEFVDKIIYPMPTGLFGKKEYHEDFICEGNSMQEYLLNLVELYLKYELEIAAQVSLAAENITRQNITTESLRRIDEIEAEQAQVMRRQKKDKEFAKVLDNFTKLNVYQEADGT